MSKVSHSFGSVVLSYQCEQCHGYGDVSRLKKHGDPENESDYEDVECGDCAGLGMHITEDGNRLLAFLRQAKQKDGAK